MISGLLLCGTNVRAQQAKQNAGRKGAVKVFKPGVYLGHGDRCGGQITKAEFDKLMKQGLTAHDSLGKKYKVISFEFTYAERSLYEDSVANLQVLTEYINGMCFGDTLSASIAGTLYERTKAGDTAFFDHVQLVRFKNKSSEPMPDSTAFLGKSMKFILGK